MNVVPADKNERNVGAGESGNGEITVRRYTMKRSGQSGWLKRYMHTTEYFDYSRREISDAEKKKRRKKAKILRAAILLAIALAAIVPLVGFVLSQLDIKDTRVDGDCVYSAAELREAAGIADDCRLFDVNKAEAAANVKEKFAKISSCTVSLKLPDTLVFTVSMDRPVLYAEIDGEYYSLSKQLRVLERSERPDTFISQGLVFAEIPVTSTAIVGRTLEFGDGSDCSYITEFIDLLESRGKLRAMTKLFLDNRFDIVAIDEGKFRIRFGTLSDLSVKLSTAQRIADMTEIEAGAGVSIDVSSPGTSGMLKIGDFNPNLRNQ